MATETKDDAADAVTRKRLAFLRSKKVLIAAAVVLAAAGGVGYKVMAPAAASVPTGGDVVALDATTLNLQGGHYLKIAVAIQVVAGRTTAEEFRTSEAAELVIDEFSDRTVASLSTTAARKALMTQLEGRIKSAYPGEVYDVFLTQFVTQ